MEIPIQQHQMDANISVIAPEGRPRRQASIKGLTNVLLWTGKLKQQNYDSREGTAKPYKRNFTNKKSVTIPVVPNMTLPSFPVLLSTTAAMEIETETRKRPQIILATSEPMDEEEEKDPQSKADKYFEAQEVLGLHSFSTYEEIQTAYKKAMLKCHPDKNNGVISDQYYLVCNAYKFILKCRNFSAH